MGRAETLARRRGAPLQATGSDRAPVRASHRHKVKARGWRWWQLRLWVSMPWAKRGRAWLCVTVLAPAARDHHARSPRPNKRPAGARQRCLVGRRWRPERALVVVTASRVAVITWSHAELPPLLIRWVLGRDPQGTFVPQAWLCTDLTADPVQLRAGFVRRWRLAVTWPEAWAHLGRAPQRPWQARAMARTPPAWLGLFSRITVWAGRLAPAHRLPVRSAVWSHQSRPTFVEALAIVRQPWRTATPVSMSPMNADRVDIPGSLLNHMPETRCDAA
jgi:hypothetical protein